MPSLLHVEDRDELRELVRNVLEPRGYQTTQARNGREAVQQLAKADFDVILLDLEMPVEAGDFVIRWVLSNRRSLLSRVLITSGSAPDQPVHEMITRLGIPVLPKPFSNDDLVQRTGELVAAGGHAASIGTADNRWGARMVFNEFLPERRSGRRASITDPPSNTRQLMYSVSPYVVDVRLEHERESPQVDLFGRISNSNGAGVSVNDLPVELMRGLDTLHATLTDPSGEFHFRFQADRNLQLAVRIGERGAIGVSLPDLAETETVDGDRRAS